MPGTLYLLPIALSEQESVNWISPDYAQLLAEIKVFAVENIRTSRRFLRQTNPSINIDNLRFIEIGKHQNQPAQHQILHELQQGNNVGIMSESGVPGIADPGSEIVLMAHQHHILVMPLVGPSSIVLLLMGSGLNGQSFTFHGYLPVKTKDRQQRIRQLEVESARNRQTQIFIETPYRNQAMFDDLLHCCRPSTLVTLGIDLTGKNQFLSTKTVDQWKTQTLEIPKLPAIFAMYAQTKI